MQAILMAGGKGTRLRPYTAVLPKPLVPLGELSIIEMLLRQLRYYGCQRVLIAVGYKAELIMAVVGDGRRFGLQVEYHIEEKALGTVGALAELPQLEDNFLVMNGDICTNLNFHALYDQHLLRQNRATVGVYRRREQIELGVIEVDGSGERIVGFREKPTYDFLVAMGVNAYHKSIVEMIPRGEPSGFDALMGRLIAEEARIGTYLFEGRWLDVGRPDDYDRMVQEFGVQPEVYLPLGA